jgi:hypothetical protein
LVLWAPVLFTGANVSARRLHRLPPFNTGIQGRAAYKYRYLGAVCGGHAFFYIKADPRAVARDFCRRSLMSRKKKSNNNNNKNGKRVVSGWKFGLRLYDSELRGRTTMTTKELRQLYGGRKPKTYLPAHNRVIHTPEFRHGDNGFRRFWIPPQWIGHTWTECPCGWRPDLGTHYAGRGHVGWWKSEIKKRGSLDAVYRYIIKRLGPDYPV